MPRDAMVESQRSTRRVLAGHSTAMLLSSAGRSGQSQVCSAAKSASKFLYANNRRPQVGGSEVASGRKSIALRLQMYIKRPYSKHCSRPTERLKFDPFRSDSKYLPLTVN